MMSSCDDNEHMLMCKYFKLKKYGFEKCIINEWMLEYCYLISVTHHTPSSSIHTIPILVVLELIQDSAISIVTRLQGSNPGWSKRMFFSPKFTDHLWSPPSLLFNAQWSSLLRTNQPRNEDDYSLPSIDEVRNEWSNTSIPPVCSHGMQRDNSVFTFTC
jgi:hypothetical protein